MASSSPHAAKNRRPGTGDQVRLMAKVARMYHERGMRQAEIAAELHVSQPRVSRLLKRAVEEGIVRTTVNEPTGAFTDLEQELESRYGLTEVVVVDPGGDDELRALGSAAAVHLETTLIGGDSIGISSWSASLLATVESLRPFTTQVVSEIVQLVGGFGDPRVQVDASRLLTQFATATGAEPIVLPAPGLLGSVQARESLMADSTVLDVSTRWPNLTMAMVGVGALEPSPLLRRSGNSIAEADQEKLRLNGAVGDVCLRFFDENGDPIASDLDDRVIGIEPDALRDIPRRIAVAGGERKRAAILGAVRGGWINVLVTDVSTARSLL